MVITVTLMSCSSPTSREYEKQMSRLYADFKTTSVEILFEVNAIDFIDYEIKFEQDHLDGTKERIEKGETYDYLSRNR